MVQPVTALILPGLVAGLAGCAADAGSDAAPFAPVYGAVDVIGLGDGLVAFNLSMAGARGPQDIEAYARCQAAGFALQRDAGFARHLRTKIDEEGGVWRADAVYTISSALPRGLRTIDAEVTVADCAERGIPTV